MASVISLLKRRSTVIIPSLSDKPQVVQVSSVNRGRGTVALYGGTMFGSYLGVFLFTDIQWSVNANPS